MPIFNYVCRTCDRHWEQYVSRYNDYPHCDQCGYAAEKEYVGSCHAVHQDSIIGGMWLENLGHEPVWVESKQQLERERKGRGLVEFVRHVSVPGTDKAPYTTNWASISKETLLNAKSMLESHAQRSSGQAPENSLVFKMEIKDRKVSEPLPDRWEHGQIIKGRDRGDY